jgi:hypothetical protein
MIGGGREGRWRMAKMAWAMDKIEAGLVGSSVERDLVVMQIGKIGKDGR